MSFFSFLKPIEHDVGKAASGTFNFLKSTAVSTINTAKNTADIVNAGRQGAQGLIQAGTAAITHNPVAEQNAIRKTNQAVDYSLNASRGAFTPQEAQSGDIVKPIIRNAAAIAPLVLPFGKIAEGASLPIRTLVKGGANAAVAGGANAATQLADTGHINPGEVAQNAAVGGVLGAAGEAVPAAVKARISPVHAHYEIGKNVTEENSIHIPVGDQGTLTVKLSELQSLAKAKTPDEVKSIIGDSLPKNVIDQITPAIAQTKDPHIISNILQKGAESTLPKPEPTIPEQVAPQASNAVQGTGETATPKPAADEAINKHLQTISNADSTTPELQEAIKGLDQTHKQRDTQQLSDQAKAAVEKDYVGSLTKVLTDENPSDKTIALGEHLIVKAQQDKKIGEAVNIAETLDKNLREHGRAIQAASIIGRLSPEGQLLRATRAIRKVREANPENITKEQNTAKEIQQQVNDSVPALDKGTIQQHVQDISNEQQKLNLGEHEGPPKAVDNTGRALAKNVEKAVTPQVKKKADALVAELTKKVKQEYLPLPNKVHKSPTDILKEVFARNGEAKEAYPLAQKILREKYANVPHMQEALDKFFGSKLDIPAASSTVDRAILETLKSKGERVSDIIYKSAQQQHATVEDIAKELVKEGFDPESAHTLVEEVSNRLGKQIAEAKQATLERLGQGIKERNQPTYLDKIHKLSNLGALDDHDYLQLARAKLDLPHLKEATANKISELSQKLQDLPEGHEKYAAVRELQHTIAKDIPKTKMQLAKEFAGLPRTILASGDFSFGARQGLVYATSHPIQFIKEWPAQFKYFTEAFKGKDSEAYDVQMADVRSNPKYNLLEKYGRLIEPTGSNVGARSEQFLSSDLAEKIPLVGRLVRGSNYAFAGLHNTLYANQFYGMLDHLDYAGIKPTEPMLKQMAEVVGTSLGRGGKSGGFTEQHAGFLSTSLFAPRLMASRLNVINPAYYIRLKGPARQEALRGLLGLSAYATAVLGTAKLAGAQVSVDPRSADFGKIKVGDTRFDVLGGFTQYIRLGAQLATGQKINSTTGAQTEAGKGLAGSRLDIASNFIQGKENPTLSFVTTMLKGKDISGNSIYNPKGVTEQVAQRFIPLLAQDMADLITHPHSAGPAAGAAGLFGVGLQTYGKEDLPISDNQKKYIQSLKSSGAPADEITGINNFFQTLKTAPKKTDAYQQIDAAIKAKDGQKLEKLVDDYNQQLQATVKPWADKYGQYGNDDLQKYYDSLKITDNAVQQRIQSAQDTKPKL